MFIHDLVLKKQQNIIQESSGLGDVYRDVAELNDLGLTLPEIAQRLGMSTQEAEEILAGIQGSANDSDISEAISRAQQAAIAISKKKEGVAETTGDPKFDKMLKGITGKKQVAKQQKADTKQQARDAFGGMFGGGNPANSLGIRKKSVDEGADDIASAKERLAHLEQIFDTSYEYSDDHSVWKKHNEIRQEMDRLKQIIRQGEQGVAEGSDESDEHDIASLQKHFDPSVAYDAASHKPAMMQRKDLKGKTHQLVKQPSGKYKSGSAPDYTPDYDQMIRDVANRLASPELMH